MLIGSEMIVSLSLSHWYPGQVWYLIVSIPDLCTLTYFMRLCLFVPSGHLLGNADLLVLVCGVFCCFLIGILGKVWYLIVWILDLCILTYFVADLSLQNFAWTE